MEQTSKNDSQLSIKWHESPEIVHRLFWEDTAIEAGVTYEALCEVMQEGEDESGNVYQIAHDELIQSIYEQKCWGFVDTNAHTIHAWAKKDADPALVIHMLAHEIGHVTGAPHPDDIQEELRADEYGKVAATAYRLLQEKEEP